jgi:hypothetical protein
MLAQRPSAEELKSARETVRNVELLLAGANKENEKAMMETDRWACHTWLTRNAFELHALIILEPIGGLKYWRKSLLD